MTSLAQNKAGNGSYDYDIVKNSDRNAEIAAEVTRRVSEFTGPGLVFTRTKEHARVLAAEIGRALGKTLPVVTSDMPKAQREQLAQRMRQADPEVPVAVATDAWATGLDIPCLRWVLLAGCGKAPIGLLQRSGRALRTDEGKEGCDVVVVSDRGRPNYQQQAQACVGRLLEAGYNADGDVSFLQSLGPSSKPSSFHRGRAPAQSPAPAPGSISSWDLLTFCLLPPQWRWLLIPGIILIMCLSHMQ